MSRKKGKKAKPDAPKYLPGVTWQDVLRRRPVTPAELERARQVKNKRLTYRCRLCSHFCQPWRPTEKMKCERCGGIMDPVPKENAQ